MSNTERFKKYKPIYKNWWLWAVVVIIILFLTNLGGKVKEESSDDGKGNNTGITQGNKTIDRAEDTDTGIADNKTDITDSTEGAGETEDTIKSNLSGTTETASEDTQSIRDNSNAKLTVLNTGKFTVGIDIPAGRYVITGDGSGNLFINSREGDSYINEILGGGELGVESVTTDLADGDVIEISGINKVTFTPADTVMRKDTLTTGSWVVGVDIAAGRYDVSSTGGNGNLFVYGENEWPKVNEILGGGEIGVEKITLYLETGDTITISGMNEVKLVIR